jgi:N utilization substance protein B
MFENDPIRDRKIPKRRLARERVMQMLYAHELGGREIPELFKELIEQDLEQADERSGVGKQSEAKRSGRAGLPSVANDEDFGLEVPANANNDRSAGDESYAGDEGALNFARKLISALTEHREEIDKLISGKLERWEMSRVALIDRLLIQLGVAELLYFPEIPPKATINELIEIAKDFSTEESGQFINGLLHAVMTQLRESGGLKKTGRGLIDKSAEGYRPAKTIRK